MSLRTVPGETLAGRPGLWSCYEPRLFGVSEAKETRGSERVVGDIEAWEDALQGSERRRWKPPASSSYSTMLPPPFTHSVLMPGRITNSMETIRKLIHSS